MRYKTNEDIILTAILPIGVDVTIRILDLVNDVIVILDTNVCTESVFMPGVYTWDTDNITGIIDTHRTMLFEMTDGTNTVIGTFIYGGYIDTLGSPVENANAVWGKVLP